VMYRWFNQHLKLGVEEPIVENDIEPLSREEMTVWNEQHPKPEGGEEYERSLLRWITEDSNRQMAALVPTDEGSLAEYRGTVGGAWDVMVGRSLPKPGAIEATQRKDADQGTWTLSTFLLRHAVLDKTETKVEEVPAVMLMPKAWNNRVVIWVDQQGKQGLFTPQGTPRAAVEKLLSAGSAVVGLDLLGQGEFTADGQPLAKQRLQYPREEPWKQYAGYTFGYNHPLFSQRVHDILSAISFARDMGPDRVRVDLVGLGGAGHWVAAARAQAGAVVERAAIDTGGFRFAKVSAIDDTDFVPGAAKYLDLPGLLALSAPGKLWLAGEGDDSAVVRQVYQAAGSADQLTIADGSRHDDETAAAEWLLPPGRSR
jgi:hypothetical protein